MGHSIVPKPDTQGQDTVEPMKIPIPFYSSYGKIYFNGIYAPEGLTLHKVSVIYDRYYNSGRYPTEITHTTYAVNDVDFDYLCHNDIPGSTEETYISVISDTAYTSISSETIGYILNADNHITPILDTTNDIRVSGGVYAAGMSDIVFKTKNAESVNLYPE